jgi:maleylpyruvate isomerase
MIRCWRATWVSDPGSAHSTEILFKQEPHTVPDSTTPTLYGFFRSGTSHRLRIALNIKGLPYDQVAIDLRKEKHLDEAYKAINPQQLVPALDIGGEVLTQSPAIIEWLEERYPTPPLLPIDPLERARVRALAAIVGCDIHPVNNRRILEALRHGFSADEAAIDHWCGTWIGAGFDAFDALVRSHGAGPFSFGAQPSLADVYLIPQMESARRFKVDVARWPRLVEIDVACGQLDAFRHAAPAGQPDAS